MTPATAALYSATGMKRTGGAETARPETLAEAAPPALTVSALALLEDGSDRRFRSLVHNLFGFLARHEAIREGHGARIGLPGVEYSVLISVAHLSQAGDVSVRTVADHLHLSGAFVTTVTNKLLAKGLIDKRTDPADRRRLRLTVTPAGRERLAALAPTQRQVNDVEFEGLTAAEFRQLCDLVERLLDSSGRAVALQRRLTEVGDGTSVAPVSRRPRR